MRLTVLGKYGPWPAAGGACSGYLVETEDVRLMLDCGCGTLGRLQQQCSLEALDGIVLSHLHADHMGDIPVLRYALPHYVGTGLMEARLPVFLPDAPQELANPILHDENIDGTAVVGGDSIEYKGVRLSFFRTRHPLQCNAVRVECEGKALVYSGDLNATEDFERFAQYADLLLIDGCLLGSEWKESMPHLSAGMAALVGKRAGARRVVLTHMRPGCDEAALLGEARLAFPAAEIAREGAQYAL